MSHPLGDSGLVAELRGMSSHALVALCVRWSTMVRTRGGMEDDSDRASVGNFIQALVEKSFGMHEFVWTFFVDPAVACPPPPPSSPRRSLAGACEHPPGILGVARLGDLSLQIEKRGCLLACRRWGPPG